ncbi:MAG: hypothetical protein K2J32_03360 [Ruminococcus sp.]|nr:hypothetical protein [Ruminococcus sp.]
MNDFNETIEKIKLYLFNYVSEIAELSMNGGRNQYVCHLCSRATCSHRWGAFIVYTDTNSYHCFADELKVKATPHSCKRGK